MRTNRLLWFLILAIWIGTSALAIGQDFRYKGSVYGGLGYGKFYEDEGSLGSGLTYRAGVEWRPLRWGGFEAELFGVRFTRSDNFQVEGNAQFVLANATWYFSRSSVQPYIKGGLGAYTTRYEYSFPSISTQTYRVSKRGLAADFGAGLRIFVNQRWSLNPDLRVMAGKNYYSLFSYFSMSAAYHW